MNPNQLADEAARLAEHAGELAVQVASTGLPIGPVPPETLAVAPIVFLFAVFVMACSSVTTWYGT